MDKNEIRKALLNNEISKEDIECAMEEASRPPMVFGYARVSTKGQAEKGNSLEAQEKELTAAGAKKIFSDVFTGAKIDRPRLAELLSEIKTGDTLIVCKLDRISRTEREGYDLIKELVDKGVAVHILNMGYIDTTPTGSLILHVFLAFAEFERTQIYERMQEGRQIARLRPGYRDGRPKKYSSTQINHALELLDSGKTAREVSELTGISRSTLYRAKLEKKRKDENDQGDEVGV